MEVKFHTIEIPLKGLKYLVRKKKKATHILTISGKSGCPCFSTDLLICPISW